MKKLYGNINTNCITFLHNDDYIALICGINIHVYSYETNTLIKILDGHNHDIVLLSLYRNNSLLSLDNEGYLKLWDLQTYTLINTKNLKSKISKACISPNYHYLYVSKYIDGHIFKYDMEALELLDDNVEDLTSIIEKLSYVGEKAKKGTKFGLRITNDGKYLLNFNGKIITIYDTESLAVVNKFQHTTAIETLEIHKFNEYIILGDNIGRIVFYYQPFNKANGQPKSSSEHWHAHEVHALCVFDNNTQFLSGGEEGVLVIWHMLTNKKTFCPRLGSAILSIKLNKENTLAAVLLQSNTLKFIKLNNFEELSSISSLTNPTIYSSEMMASTSSSSSTLNSSSVNSSKSIFSTSFVKYPKTNVFAMESSPGHIQFFDPIRLQKIKDYPINKRNFTSRGDKDYPSPLIVNHLAFDHEGKYMVTLEQRSHINHTDNYNICYLKFWDEIALYDFELNTIVESPHDLHSVNGVVSARLNNQDIYFITYANKYIKFWKKVDTNTSIVSKSLNTERKYFWRPFHDLTIKNLTITNIKYITKYNNNDIDYLVISAANLITIYDLRDLCIVKTIKIGENDIKEFQLVNDLLFVSNGNTLYKYNLNESKIESCISLPDIKQIIPDECNNTVILINSNIKPNEKTALSLITTVNTSDLAIKQIAVLKDSIDHAELLEHQDSDNILFIFNQQFSFVYLDPITLDSSHVFEQKLANIFSNKAIKSVEHKPYVQTNQYGDIQKLFVREKSTYNVDPRRFLSQKSHLLPSVSLMLKPFIDYHLTKLNKLNDYESNDSIEDPNQAKQYNTIKYTLLQDKSVYEDQESDMEINNNSNTKKRKYQNQLNDNLEKGTNPEEEKNKINDEEYNELSRNIKSLFMKS